MGSFFIIVCWIQVPPQILCPWKVMQQLGLDISQPYQNMCESESKPITVCGLINNIRVSLDAFPDISFVIDVVIIDVPSIWGILLSKELVTNLEWIFQMDGSSATIPHPEGGLITLYKEPITRCLVESPKSPMDQIFFLEDRTGNLFIVGQTFKRKPCHNPNGTWKL
jgi:hypothetical protein